MKPTVLQVWVGREPPPADIIEKMRAAREASEDYILLTNADSPLLDELDPTVDIDDSILLSGIRSSYENVDAYLGRFGRDVLEVSDVLRFKALAIHPQVLYVDVDATVPTALPVPSYGWTDLEGPIFGRHQGEADIHLLWNGEATRFFSDCLKGLSPSKGPYALRQMVAGQPRRFPEGSYTHEGRKGRY